MTVGEYFGDWLKVIDKKELARILKWLDTLDSIQLCPSKKDVFKVFKICPFKECKVIILSQDPYPQKGVATGIAFGNKEGTNISPSLEIIKEACINYEIPHNPIIFDQTLESWVKQGVLLLNSALTCMIGNVGVHTDVWRPFMSKLINNISHRDSGLVWVLYGSVAQSYEQYIDGKHKIIRAYHPAYYARKNEKMPYSVFQDINKFLKEQYNEQIKFYSEYGKESEEIYL